MTAKKTKPRYVTRWILEYEYRRNNGSWMQVVDMYSTLEHAREGRLFRLNYFKEHYRNTIPPQKVRVQIR